MPLVSYGIPNLSNGVSQQPAPLRLPTSCEEMVNAWPSVLSGLQKRPPTEWIAKLNTTIEASAAGHIIRRDNTVYQYIVLANRNDLVVYDVYGTKQTVNFPNGKAYLNQAINPVESLRFMTFGDYTFIANKEVKVTSRTWGEGGKNSTFTPTGTVASFADLPTATSGGDVYYVSEDGVYYKSEYLSALAQTIGWVRVGGPFGAVPTGYTSVTSLPAVPTLGQKVALQKVELVLGTPVVKYWTYEGQVTSPARAAGYYWIAKKLSDLTTVTSGRLDPATHGTIVVKQAIANSYYAVYVNGVKLAEYLTPKGVDAASSVPSTDVIATQLASDLTTGGYSVSQNGSTLTITNLGATATLRAKSPSGDKAIQCYRYTVNSFSDLPPNEKDNRVLRIAGDPSVQGDDYFVQYVDGIWEECVGWNQAGGFDDISMPWVLVRESNGTWTFKPFSWDDRSVGSETSNKFPSFVGAKINDIFVYSNRLGFLADENVVLSEADSFSNFFRTTVAQFLDSDRIDVAVFSKDVNILRHAIPFSKDLLLSADNNQFRLSYNGVLTAKNIQIEYTTSFNVSHRVKPANMGGSVYFADDRSSYTYARFLEYYAKENQTGDDIDDLTEAVPEYIPADIRFMAASPRMHMLVTNSYSAPNKLFCYKFYWAGGQKVQNAWGTWTLSDCTYIHWAGFLDNYLYVVVERPDGLHLERILTDENVFRNASDFTAHVDRRIAKSKLTFSYNESEDETTVTLPYSTSVVPECISFQGDVKAFRSVVTKLTNTTFKVDGDIRGASEVIVGIPYTFEYTFSKQYMRKPKASGGTMLLLEGRLQLRYMTIEYHNTAYFKFTVSQPGRTDVETIFDGRLVGSKDAVLGQASFGTGNKRIPLMAFAEDVTLKITNDSPYANAFGSAEWQAIYHPKSQRIN